MTSQAELAHLFRALKAPGAARALPGLVERAREGEWSYERFAEALLATELHSREASGGELRITAARFPARKTLEDFDFAFARSIKKTTVLHLAQLDFLHAYDCDEIQGFLFSEPLAADAFERFLGAPAQNTPATYSYLRA